MKTKRIVVDVFYAVVRLRAWLVYLLFFGVTSTTYAETKLDSAKALRSINGNWWNRESNSYNPPTANSTYDNSLRKDGRIAQPSTSNWKFPSFNFAWFGAFWGYLLTIVLTVLMAIALVLLGMHLVRSYRPPPETDYSSSQIKIDPARIEELPFEAVQWVGDPLAEARKLAQQGRFDEAIIYLYGYQLLALDQSRKIHLHKGKTNRMYLREIEPFPQLREIVGLTMGQFEEVFFGKHSLSKQSFLEAWTKLDLFHALISQSTGQKVPAIRPAWLG
jgi:hypothetical protein